MAKIKTRPAEARDLDAVAALFDAYRQFYEMPPDLALARRYGLPWRSGGGALTSSPAVDAQAAYESANTMQPTLLAGTNFVLHAAGWLEGGLTMGYEKFVLDADQLGMWHAFASGVDLSENGQALDAQ